MRLIASGAADTATVASAWVAGVAAVVAVAAVVVAIWQARSARDQAKAAHDQVAAATSQADSARAQAESAKRQADAAVAQTELQQRALRDSHQPYVWADIRPDPIQGSIFQLVIRNDGPTVAEDVRVVFDPPLATTPSIRTKIDKVQSRLTAGFRSLPPGREMVWYLAMGREMFTGDSDSDGPREHVVTITGQGPFGEMPTQRYTLNLSDARETADVRTGSLAQVTKAIEKVAENVG